MSFGRVNEHGCLGKYKVMSLEGNQYYILFVDDTARYITIDFLKRKDQVNIKVKVYLIYLKTHGWPQKFGVKAQG